jgi:hypothetical protein
VGGGGRLPVWLLDVDGVLNCPRPGWGTPVRHGRLVAELGIAYDLFWADEAIDFVRRVHEEGLAEVRWATTWVGWTHLLEQLWDLASLPEAFAGDVESPGEEKLPAALAVVEDEHRPLVWTDDDRIPPTGEARDRLIGADQPTLLLTPDPVRGLRPSDAEMIETFLRSRFPDLGDPTESQMMQSAEYVTACARRFGEHDSRTSGAWRTLADEYERAGRPDRAVRARKQLVWSFQRGRDPDARDTLLEQYALASDLLLTGDPEQAITLLVDTLTRCHRVLDHDDWLILAVQDTLTNLTDLTDQHT